MKLTRSQLDAVRHLTGPAMIAAGPGSGKTTVIVQHILFLIQIYGVDPEKILVLTFTRAAANEMAARFRRSFSEQANSPVFGTFHSVFFHMLKECEPGPLQIISERDRIRIIRSLLRQVQIVPEEADKLISQILSEISRAKNGNGQDEKGAVSLLTGEQFRFIQQSYQQALAEMRMLDYDDILLRMKQILLTQPETVRKWKERFSFLLVDEFQDINQVQYDILKLLAFPDNNLFVVGDINQCIYSFRGSRPELMKQFQSDYPDVRHVFLDQNFRCAEVINAAAVKLLNAGPEKNVRPMHAANPCPDAKCVIHCYQDMKEEYTDIAVKIKEFHQKGITYEQMTVLLRSSNDMPYLCSMLTRNGIPCFAAGQKDPFPDHFIVRDILAYLKTANGIATRSDLLRVLKALDVWIPRHALPEDPTEDWMNQILAVYREDPDAGKELKELQDHLRFLQKLSVYAATEYILHALGYRKYLTNCTRQQALSPDVYDPVLERIRLEAKKCPTQDHFIKRLSGMDEGETPDESSSAFEHAVRIQTMHASKGLEYDVVFIPDLNKGIMPASQAEKENLEEERRLLYVAMTRARVILQLSYVAYTYGKKVSPSIFIRDLTE